MSGRRNMGIRWAYKGTYPPNDILHWGTPTLDLDLTKSYTTCMMKKYSYVLVNARLMKQAPVLIGTM